MYNTTTINYDYRLTSTNDGQAYITTKRNRVKTYGNNVHLKDKQEFEIELFNPTTSTKAAEISINGKLISTSKLVLKPGQRVYLERFLDTAKKFQFETYDVSFNPVVMQAIANNGDIEVKFYDEYIVPQYNYRSNTPWTYSTNIDCINTCYNTSSFTGEDFKSGLRSRKSTAGGQSVNSVETGRVEQGSESNQKFTNYSGQFNSYTSNVVRIKILPFSQKPLEVKDLTEYCTNCGTKNKRNNYKYCPKCGQQF